MQPINVAAKALTIKLKPPSESSPAAPEKVLRDAETGAFNLLLLCHSILHRIHITTMTSGRLLQSSRSALRVSQTFPL